MSKIIRIDFTGLSLPKPSPAAVRRQFRHQLIRAYRLIHQNREAKADCERVAKLRHLAKSDPDLRTVAKEVLAVGRRAQIQGR